MQKQIKFIFLTFALFWASGCGQDIQPGNQYAGQLCYETSDCAPNLACRGRTCVPVVVGSNTPVDMPDDMTIPPDMSKVDGTFTDMKMDMTLPPECRLGERICIDGGSYRVCERQNGGVGFGQEIICAPNTRCNDGQCESQCIDRDGDGFFRNCEPFDCDDTRQEISPRAEEICDNNQDDNCNRQVDEGCNAGCCDGGCGVNEFCDQCACKPFDPNQCVNQNQPCNFEGESSNGYFCADIFGNGEARCIGVCSVFSDNPDDDCPDPNSTCTFETDGMGTAVCLSTCKISEGCPAGLGCLPYDNDKNEGICVPVSRNPVGSQCDPDQFFDCVEGAICAAQRNGQPGRCEEACRPFKAGQTTDCSMGNYCQVADTKLGICQPDNGSTEGDFCRPFGSSCGEDAVGCYPFNNQQQTCTRLCRLAEAGTDCPANAICTPFDQNGDLGYCAAGPP